MTRLVFSDDQPRIDWSEIERFAAVFGKKAATSLAIPRPWSLPFALVPTEATSEIASGKPLSKVLTSQDLVRIKRLAQPGNEIIVRSSVVGESIWDRGTYTSVEVKCDSLQFGADFDQAVRTVISSAEEKLQGLLVQRYVRPVLAGEFGNLLRISKTRDHWEISTVEASGFTTRQRLNSQRDQAANPDTPLAVRSGVARERLFGSLGAWLNNELVLGRSQRLNCEWLTDNRYYYLVQIDEENEDLFGVNPFQVRVPAASYPKAASGFYLKQADDRMLAHWDKLLVLRELWEPDALHKPMLFCVPVMRLPKASDRSGFKQLVYDFESLIGSTGIVVRTSVRAGQKKPVNLPRTECLDPEAAAKWCIDKSAELGGEQDVSNLAFIAHHFVASRASAWIRAEPDSPIVEINALWGLPDALQYCPYDIWEVHVPTGIVTEYPDYKSDMLISTADGGWAYARVKNELARNNCIGSNEAKELATRSAAIAKRLGRACHIMWFVGCVDTDGALFNIPWYWTEAHQSERNPDRSAYKVFDVTDEESLDKFKQWSGSRLRQALSLRPTELRLMRDNAFITAVGQAARDANVPIILHGSTLAHAYYQLRSLGCVIVTSSEKKGSRIRRTATFGKLVRDKIPGKIADRQEIEVTRKIPNNLKARFLISKLFEEALEVREAINQSAKTEELADLFEVFRAIAETEQISLGEIKKMADQKKDKSGGFDEGLVLVQTGIGTSERRQSAEFESQLSQIIADHAAEDTAEIPFSFFGFMELDRPRLVYFDQFAAALEITLRSDRIELRLVREPQQLDLPIMEDAKS
ncbi:MAG: nucleoside triphosphate pyrophosphohydrolase [Flavobacteriaceae bacterium]